MGYYMTQKDSNFCIEKKNHKNALAAIKKLAERIDEEGNGGSFSGGTEQRWFIWVNTDEFLNANTIDKAMLAWRWEVGLDANGDITSICFNGEKLGQDEILFKAIAPYVKEGSFIEMQGEDGLMWKWVFDGKTMKEKTARIVYDD